ncbi:MAG: M48 family metalloprotease [Verrucomicrobiota bacterium]
MQKKSRKLKLFAAAFLLLPILARAGDLTGLYDRATLEYWRTQTPEGIEENFREVVLPVLTTAEKERLGKVEFEFPLTCDEAQEPFCFSSRYARNVQSAAPSKVQMSMLALRFFGDLALATAWLQRNGYVLDTVSDYVAMLKFRDAASFPEGKYPRPLDALQIPADVRDQKKPAFATFSKIYDSAIVFILAHELGHIYHRHAGYGPGVSREQSRRNEEEADAFGLDLMRRIGVAPIGAVVFFTAYAHWTPNRWDFPDEEKYQAYLAQATHPLTSHRMRALGQRIGEARRDFARKEANPEAVERALEYIATQIRAIADFLDDHDVQEGIAVVSRTTDLLALAPRRPGALPLAAPKNGNESQSTEPFNGTYTGKISDRTGELDTIILLERKGSNITGAYSFGLGMGTIRGRIEGDVFLYDWRSGELSGKGKFTEGEHPGTLVGTWGNGDSRDNAGKWNATRRKSGATNP